MGCEVHWVGYFKIAEMDHQRHRSRMTPFVMTISLKQYVLDKLKNVSSFGFKD